MLQGAWVTLKCDVTHTVSAHLAHIQRKGAVISNRCACNAHKDVTGHRNQGDLALIESCNVLHELRLNIPGTSEVKEFSLLSKQTLIVDLRPSWYRSWPLIRDNCPHNWAINYTKHSFVRRANHPDHSHSRRPTYISRSMPLAVWRSPPFQMKHVYMVHKMTRKNRGNFFTRNFFVRTTFFSWWTRNDPPRENGC